MLLKEVPDIKYTHLKENGPKLKSCLPFLKKTYEYYFFLSSRSGCTYVKFFNVPFSCSLIYIFVSRERRRTNVLDVKNLRDSIISFNKLLVSGKRNDKTDLPVLNKTYSLHCVLFTRMLWKVDKKLLMKWFFFIFATKDR